MDDAPAVRAPRRDDLAAVVALMRACDVVEFGRPDTDDADVLAEWDSTGFSLADDGRVVVEIGSAGRIVGYAQVFETHAQVVVHPEHNGRGVGTTLRGFTETRALKQAGEAAERTEGGREQAAEVKIWQAPRRTNNAAHRLLAAAGYARGHHYAQMEVELAQEPPEATWPEGVTVRTFAPGRDERACHALQNLAWGQYETYEPISLERWTDMAREPDFDPELWFLAEAGGELLGTCLCRQYDDQSWVTSLSVRPGHRGRGLGEALLRHAFARLRARGNVRVGLSISSRTTKSAWRLYERVGMRDAGGWIAYEKVLRAAEPS